MKPIKHLFQYIGLLMLALFLGQALAASEIYKKIEADGHIIYSDTPLDDAEVIEISPIKTYPSQPIPEDNAVAAPDEMSPPENYSVNIVSPDNDSFIPVGTNGINVKIFTVPKLYEAHLLRLNIDSKPYGDAQSGNSFTIKALDNGTHRLQAIVVTKDDLNQTISTSNEITIHTKRSFFFNPLLPPAPQMPRAPQAPLAPRAP